MSEKGKNIKCKLSFFFLYLYKCTESSQGSNHKNGCSVKPARDLIA